MTPRGLYLLVGPDRVRKLQRVQAIERALQVGPLDRHRLDARDLPAPALLALCRQSPAIGIARLIIVDEAQRLPAEAVDALTAQAARVADAACVVLLMEGSAAARHPLSVLVRDAARTQPWHVETFAFREGAAARPFALVEALGRRALVEAVQALRDQQTAGRNAVELFGQVVWLVQRWVTVKRLVLAGDPAERIADATGMRPWQVRRLQTETSHRSLTSLEQLLTRCWELEAAAKRGAALPELAIEQLVAELCVRGDAQAKRGAYDRLAPV